MALVSAVGQWLSKGVYQTAWSGLGTGGVAGSLASVGRALSGAGQFGTITVTVSGSGGTAGVGTLILQGHNGLTSGAAAFAQLHTVSGGNASFLATAVKIISLAERPNFIQPKISASTSKAKYKVQMVSSIPFR